jgi:hypothetical protein
MNESDIKKMNFKYCPKCNGHLRFRLTKSNDGKQEFSMVCNNGINSDCDFKKVLTADNVSDCDRHKIIESYFGYNKPFSISIDNWENSLLRYLFFLDTKDFLYWFFHQIKIQSSLDHNNSNIAVGSPYPLITRELSKFLHDNYQNDFVDQLNLAFSSFDNQHKFDNYLHLTSYQAKELFIFRDIERNFPTITLATLFSEDDNTIQNVVETFCSRIYSKSIWTNFLKPLDTEQLFLGVRKVFELFQKTNNNSLKPLIQTLYSLLVDHKSTSGELLDFEIQELTDWILLQTDDTDLPFSSTNYSAKSTHEYLFRLNLDREIKSILNYEQSKLNSEKLNLNNQLQTLFSELTAIQNQINETNLILASKEKAIERFEEIKSFTGLNSISRLKKIVNSERPIFYFPDILFKDTINYLDLLDLTEKQKLKVKLKTAKKGILKELKIKLDTLGL